MLRRLVLVLTTMGALTLVWVSPVQATFTISVDAATATITGDASVLDQLAIGKSGANLTHDGSVDWDAQPGDQVLPDLAGVHIVVNAGDGIDIVTVGAPGDTFAASIAVRGEGGADFVHLNAGGGGSDTVTISGNSLVAPGGGTISWDDSTDQVYVRTNGGSDTVNVAATPTSPQVLVYAEGGDDSLKLANGTGLGAGGTFRGGPGTDTVDYSAYSTPVTVDLGKTARFEGALTGANAVPANANANAATADAAVEFSDLATNTFSYEVFVDGLTAALITDAHVHQGSAGTNGAAILPIGAGGSWTDPDAPNTDPSTEVGPTTDPDITESALRAGNTYVDVHSGGGDIRAQLTLDPDDGYGGSGTGLSRVFTVENLVGGSGNDTFKGSVPHNTFTCGSGQDSVTTDATDTVAGCETVNGVTTNPPAPAVGSVSKLKPKAKAKGAKVTIDTGATATCPATATGSCQVLASAKAKIGKKTVTLGKLDGKAGTVAAGTSLRVKLKVSRKSLKAWRKAGRLKVTVTVQLGVPGGSPVTVTKTVKLRAPAAR